MADERAPSGIVIKDMLGNEVGEGDLILIHPPTDLMRYRILALEAWTDNAAAPPGTIKMIAVSKVQIGEDPDTPNQNLVRIATAEELAAMEAKTAQANLEKRFSPHRPS